MNMRSSVLPANSMCALFRLYSGSIQALFRLYSGPIQEYHEYGEQRAHKRREVFGLEGQLCVCACVIIRQHTSAYVSIRQHASEYVSIRQHTSAYVSIQMR
jgi:hypothetical protein